MIKDWSEAPEWARWRAKDSSGEVWYYENEPAKHHKVQMWVALDGQQVFGVQTGSGAGWDASLEEPIADDAFNEDWYDGLL